MIELYLLEQLKAFSRHGTLSGATEELHISQPALSQSMKKLEDGLGVSLFERSKNRIALNENGILAAQLGEKLLEQSREMEERLHLFDRSRRTISLGVCAPVPLWDLSPLLAQLYDEYLYKLRHLVENCFLALKRWRGIATRYAKTSDAFIAAVQIRCIAIWAAIRA